MAVKVKRYAAAMLVMLSYILFTAPAARADILVPPKYYNDIKFVVGSGAFYVNQKPAALDAPPFIAGGRAYIPVRFLLEAIGMPDGSIAWDAAAQSVEFPYRLGVSGNAPRIRSRSGIARFIMRAPERLLPWMPRP